MCSDVIRRNTAPRIAMLLPDGYIFNIPYKRPESSDWTNCRIGPYREYLYYREKRRECRAWGKGKIFRRW